MMRKELLYICVASTAINQSQIGKYTPTVAINHHAETIFVGG